MAKETNNVTMVDVMPNITDPSMRSRNDPQKMLKDMGYDETEDIRDLLINQKSKTKEETSAASQESTSTSSLLIIVFALIIIALVAIIIWMFVKEKEDKSEEEEIKRQLRPNNRNQMANQNVPPPHIQQYMAQQQAIRQQQALIQRQALAKQQNQEENETEKHSRDERLINQTQKRQMYGAQPLSTIKEENNNTEDYGENEHNGDTENEDDVDSILAKTNDMLNNTSENENFTDDDRELLNKIEGVESMDDEDSDD